MLYPSPIGMQINSELITEEELRVLYSQLSKASDYNKWAQNSHLAFIRGFAYPSHSEINVLLLVQHTYMYYIHACMQTQIN